MSLTCLLSVPGLVNRRGSSLPDWLILTLGSYPSVIASVQVTLNSLIEAVIYIEGHRARAIPDLC